MRRRGGGRLSRTIQFTLVLGMASLGCQASMSSRLLMGPGDADQAVDNAYARHEARGQGSTIQQASYRGEDEAGAGAGGEGAPRPRVLKADGTNAAAGMMMPDGMIVDGALAGPDGPIDPQSLPLPTEKSMTYHPPYVIEPPDVLFIQALRMIPKPPYRINPLDVLSIIVPGSELNPTPIGGNVSVTPDGTVDLGPPYGSVTVAGLTLKQAANAIRLRLTTFFKNPQVRVSLMQFTAMQQTSGEHLVGMDGTVTLGTYGCVNVTGLTLPQAKCAIEKHLSQFLLNPQVSISVAAYNSKVYYVIADGAGFGEQVFRFPITGKETVLDAVGQIRGLPPNASKRVWVARPAPCNHGCYQILPVDWDVIVRAGDTCTNYQIFPGDRVYIKASTLICLNNYLIKILAPVEQIFGVTLLGAATYSTIKYASQNNNNNNNSGVLIP